MTSLKVFSVLIRLEGGGAERSVARIVDPLAKRGITMARYALDGPWQGEEGDSSKTLANESSRGMRRVLSAAMRLARVIRKEQPHVLHLHCEAPEVVGLITRFLTPDCKYGIVVTDHSMKSWSGRKAAVGTAVRWALSRCGALYVNCFLSLRPQDRIPVVLNPTGPVGALAPGTDLPPRLVVIGRVIESKRIDQILRAAHACSWPNEIVIMGAGSASAALHALAEELDLHVAFHGHQSNPWSFVRKDDIFVSASAFEGEPLTLIEALQHNLAVVVSNIPAHVKVLHDHDGIFSTSGELAQMLSAYYKSEKPGGLFKVDSALRGNVLHRRDPERIAQEWETIYRDVTRSWMSSAS